VYIVENPGLVSCMAINPVSEADQSKVRSGLQVWDYVNRNSDLRKEETNWLLLK